MTKYESIIRRIAVYLSNREYARARHHIKRIWNRMDDMTDTEQYVLRQQALVAFNK